MLNIFCYEGWGDSNQKKKRGKIWKPQYVFKVTTAFITLSMITIDCHFHSIFQLLFNYCPCASHLWEQSGKISLCKMWHWLFYSPTSPCPPKVHPPVCSDLASPPEWCISAHSHPYPPEKCGHSVPLLVWDSAR